MKLSERLSVLQDERAYSGLIEDSQPSRYSKFQKFKGAMKIGILVKKCLIKN